LDISSLETTKCPSWVWKKKERQQKFPFHQSTDIHCPLYYGCSCRNNERKQQLGSLHSSPVCSISKTESLL